MSTLQKAQSPGGAGQSANETANIEIVGQQPEIFKLETTLIAQFALAGHEVHSLADGGYLVTKWGQSRHCPDLQALAVFARQIGAVK